MTMASVNSVEVESNYNIIECKKSKQLSHYQYNCAAVLSFSQIIM